MGENQIPFALIFTKADKLKPQVIQKQADKYINALLEGIWEDAPQYFITSSSNNLGREEVLEFIGGINDEFFKATAAK